MSWGLPAPAGVNVSWGARAIYTAPDGVDILWDRQGFTGDEKECKKLATWLNKSGLKAFKKFLKKEYLGGAEHREVRMERGGYVIIANPRQSYGYLYLGAWKAPT